MATRNIQVLLANRPEGWVTESDFDIVENDIPQPRPGEILIENQWLSLDPYMRGRMSAGKSYAAATEIGDVMTGGTVGKVIASQNPKFSEGDTVVGGGGSVAAAPDNLKAFVSVYWLSIQKLSPGGIPYRAPSGLV